MFKRSLLGPGPFVLAASLALAAVPPAAALGSSQPPPRVAAPIGPGDAAPDFTLKDVADTEHMLTDYRGKLVLLWFLGYG